MGQKYSVMLFASLLLSATAVATAASAQTATPKVVLELFTSQGCSSCPPADALLESYLKRDDVIALSVPVDYWDRLGWKDTFAKRDYTARQQEYAAARGDGQVDTPQIVVSGTSYVVGSSRYGIDSVIAEAKKGLLQFQVSVRARFDGDALIVEVGSAAQGAQPSNARLLLAVVHNSRTVAIRRGENANRSVTYHNVVRSLKTIGTWTGEPVSLRVAKTEYAVDGGQSLAILLQAGAGGPIFGAAQNTDRGSKDRATRAEKNRGHAMLARWAFPIAAMNGGSAWAFTDTSPDWGMWFGMIIVVGVIAAVIAVIVVACRWAANRSS